VSEPVLEGLKGVELVNSDFYGSRERTTAWYDPALISIDEMVKALKEVGIFRGIENRLLEKIKSPHEESNEH
jgi:hypothetical protein